MLILTELEGKTLQAFLDSYISGVNWAIVTSEEKSERFYRALLSLMEKIDTLTLLKEERESIREYISCLKKTLQGKQTLACIMLPHVVNDDGSLRRKDVLSDHEAAIFTIDVLIHLRTVIERNPPTILSCDNA